MCTPFALSTPGLFYISSPHSYPRQWFSAYLSNRPILIFSATYTLFYYPIRRNSGDLKQYSAAMRFFNVLVLSLSTVSAFVIPRGNNVDLILNDITALDNAVKDLTSSLENFSGGLFTVFQTTAINANVAKVHTANRKGYYDATLFTSNLNSADSMRVANLAASTLAVDNPKACNLIKSKKKLFDGMMMSSLVSAALKTLLDDHVSLSNILLQRCSADARPKAQVVIDTITDVLQDAITYYS